MRWILMFAIVAGCGGGDDDDDVQPDASGRVDSAPIDQRYLPLVIGATWTYQVTDTGTGAMGTKTSTVEAYEDVGGAKAGIMAFRVRTEKLDGTTVSWQEDLGNKIIRHREQTFDVTGTMLRDETYDPYKLRVDETAEHTAMGATWQQTYVESIPGGAPIAKAETWTVEAVDESITVLGMPYTTIRVRRMGQDVGQSDKTYWFAKGIGKIQETGGQTEELMSYSRP